MRSTCWLAGLPSRMQEGVTFMFIQVLALPAVAACQRFMLGFCLSVCALSFWIPSIPGLQLLLVLPFLPLSRQIFLLFKSSVPSFISKLCYPIQYSHDVTFAGSDGDTVCRNSVNYGAFITLMRESRWQKITVRFLPLHSCFTFCSDYPLPEQSSDWRKSRNCPPMFLAIIPKI